MSKATHRTIRKQLETNAQHRREVEALDKVSVSKLKGFEPATVGDMHERAQRQDSRRIRVREPADGGATAQGHEAETHG
jgi:hypothetical protein